MSDSRRRYNAVKQKLRQLHPEQWHDQEDIMTNLSLMTSAIVKAKDLTQNAIAAEMPINAQDTSLCQRQRRWVKNERVDENKIYDPFITPIVQAMSKATIPLILDTTSAGINCHLLVASVAYHKRALPMRWSAGNGSRGHTSAKRQKNLLDEVAALLPIGSHVVTVGDGEFSSVETLKWHVEHGWDFVLRVACDTYIFLDNEPIRIDNLAVGHDGLLWLEDVQLTKDTPFGPLNLLVCWDESRQEFLPLITSLPVAGEAQHWYKKRFWTEPFFGDIKGHGFDFQSSRLQHPERISKLMLAISLAYLWMISLGVFALVSGVAKFVDRTDRRDRSLFTIGRLWLNRLIKLDKSFIVSFFPYPYLRDIPPPGVG